jgi:DnaJ-class molecular chaperone
MTGTVNLTIPPGTQGGQIFRLKGKGMPKLRQKDQFGNLHARIKIRIPTELSQEEQELYQQLAQLQQPTTQPL